MIVLNPNKVKDNKIERIFVSKKWYKVFFKKALSGKYASYVMKIMMIFFGEDVAISGYLPPSLVTFCHQIRDTSLPPSPGNALFEWPQT